jgi:hypothetical protein
MTEIDTDHESCNSMPFVHSCPLKRILAFGSGVGDPGCPVILGSHDGAFGLRATRKSLSGQLWPFVVGPTSEPKENRLSRNSRGNGAKLALASC